MNVRTAVMTTMARVVVVGMALSGPAVLAVPKIGDITHLQGSRTNKLTGMGLVVGLQGTGDGGKYAPTIRALASLHKKFASPVITLDEMKDAKNVAIVQVDATLPENGAREGDRVDVMVSSLGPAKSLKGGRLLLTPLLGPNPDDSRGVMALASGPLQLSSSEANTVARISQGATMEQDWIHSYVAWGREMPPAIRNHAGIRPEEAYVTLILDDGHNEWGIAYTIARTINSAQEIGTEDGANPLAIAIDPRTVMVRIPAEERDNPAGFLYRLEGYQLIMPPTEARVVIHQATGTVVISGDVEISPVVISHKGLTITTAVSGQSLTPEKPPVATREFVPLDPQNKGGARLQDLVDALNLLRVPPPDKIVIIKKLHEMGRLHATLIMDQ